MTRGGPGATLQPMPTILLGVSGSIAAYKSADLASALRQKGHEVHAVLTRAAREFVTPLTLSTLTRNPVLTDLEDEKKGWIPGHIELADRADLLLLAPASADLIARVALGLADDSLTSVALACRAPLLVAPAMNGKMWSHPATMGHVRTLKERRANFVGPGEGMLACGYEGVGRLAPVDEILAAAERILADQLR